MGLRPVLRIVGRLGDPLAVQNVVLLGINLFGVYRYLWLKPKDRAAD